MSSRLFMRVLHGRLQPDKVKVELVAVWKKDTLLIVLYASQRRGYSHGHRACFRRAGSYIQFSD
jgi:hypothetical protein